MSAPSTGSPSQSTAEAIRSTRLVAILRGPDAEHLAAGAEALVDEGVRVLEFPIAGPEILSVVSTVAARLGSAAHIGAGTVRTVADARRALDAGANFLVAPSLSIPVIDYARQRDIAVVPGVFTPTEIDAATQAGAEVVKLFPASSHTPKFLRQLHAPLPDAGIMPTGTITRDDAHAWLNAGAVALGVGSDLTGDSLTTGDLTPLRAAARDWLLLVTASP
ncbi:bifunctional 4-hydroxy-2-oxoglutarate aldolase/2-dehydro-3-deoxy-phosphogluconate aldolase [Myceligenerans pegani]|uniref:Bifunctional 4-hydroxy-2-oxoglutarate aldolase/2-dehydro-3-deoxy-phosphogluconate aldolase n=1 Tax=Myceligenerans pegani TaxID=2776917 RepID=A0ABR9N4E4_9MICO|nr:bifunctional 4-hydroxy-2-oxoglutarate aldolase/2-dehydro-3-deoxy-phosphogluconate aldolase [Myceligenerans sp. TRM 65318]MBE1877852.1 bifunctional 4-hydroxy-2-oxoglutarate aldolase/2-dehydro-3-deoxy-phosphogluconate aldolase [Myceligenerans sp. TRM 65318]MBE3020123.1 bifunctional 4-hydroxy-2-oxoglutarate aldolase/2-dehydro-3-deoxy-phosphogluconate aldolase [Myceligenerans sp. TRM 65318]